MRRFWETLALAAAAMGLTLAMAVAQTPPPDPLVMLQNDYIALQIALGHVGTDIAALQAAVKAAEKKPEPEQK